MEGNNAKMDLASGFTSEWKLMRVNPDTWENMAEVPGVKTVKVNRDGTDDYPMLEAATVNMDVAVGDEFEEGYYRIVMRATEGRGFEAYDIATLLMQSSSGTTDRRVTGIEVTGTSVLQGAKDKKLLVGTYAPKGVDGADYCASLLRECIPAPVTVDGSFTLDEHVVFGVGISYLQAVWTILDYAGWCIRISGRGEVRISKKPETATLLLDKANARKVLPGIDYTLDLSGIPNVYYAVYGDTDAKAVNDNPDSRVSTVTRGREVDEVDTSPVPVNGETLDAYCRRKLEELSTVVKTYTYTREWEDIVPFDMVEASLSEHGISGELRVLTQSITCDAGIVVDEKVGMEIKEFVA